ncbi:MAG: class I SAM-dependent methyltransferase [Rhodospirillales bacterium]
MAEIDLMSRYPKSVRADITAERVQVSEEDRRIARQFGWEYFDGPRRLGMGGYHYNPKFFTPVVEDMIAHYGLTDESSILDVGCAKGFMLHDFRQALPGCTIAGIDISTYCLENAMETVAGDLQCASCDDLPFEDDSFDLVISIATIHNLDVEGVKRSLREIMRVSRKHAFIKVNGYRTTEERDALEAWNLVARTILPVEEWEAIFDEVGYTADYYWFTP